MEEPGLGPFGFNNIGIKLKGIARPMMIVMLTITGVMAYIGSGMLWVTLMLILSFALPYAMYALGQIADDVKDLKAHAWAADILKPGKGESDKKDERGGKIR